MKPRFASCRTRLRDVLRPCWFRLPSLAVLLLAAWSAWAQPAQTRLDQTRPVEITDDLGRVVRLETPAQRVVCLYGGLTETVIALDKREALAARTKADDGPELAGLPSVGTHMRPNLELIAGLAPDLVLQQGGRDEALDVVADLENLGLTVALFNPSSFQELFSTMERVGLLLGAQDQARNLTAGLQARLDAVAGILAEAQPRPRVVFEIRYPNLLCAGQGSLVTEIMAWAGGINALQAPGKVVRLSEEELLRLDPDAYLIQQGPMNPAPLPLAQRPLFRNLRCAARTLTVDEALFSRPGPRSVLAVEQLARFLHPGCFALTEKQATTLHKDQQ